MHGIRLFSTTLVISFLAGCAGVLSYPGPEETWYDIPKPGSQVQVKQTLTSDGGARISIQNGRVMSWNDVYKLNPYCQFHVMRSSSELSEPLRIEPGTFTVSESYRRKDIAALEGVRYAFMGDEDFDHSPSQRTMATYLELSSQARPDVYRLVCARWADPYNYNHLSIKEIRQTLGDLVSLVTN